MPMMRLARTVLPELLDELPPGDSRGQHSRRDLRRINRIMMSASILAATLRQHYIGKAPPRRILELGAGDGSLMLALAGRLARHWPDATVMLLDRQPLIAPETMRGIERLGWRVKPVCADAFAWLEHPRPTRWDVTLANLFIHHFSAAHISGLLEGLSQHTGLIAACEPRRSTAALWASRCLGLIGANDVTRHDALVSVKAGFAGDELSQLWPLSSKQAWRLHEREAGPFSHVFVARRER